MMKTIITTIMLALGVMASAQMQYTIQWRPDYAEQLSFVLIHEDTGDTLFSWINLGYSQLNNNHTIILPVGITRLDVTDIACDGWGCYGYMSFVNPNGNVIYVDGNFNCTQSLQIVVLEYPEPCPTDLNGDGYTGVEDLLIFIPQYGQTCE